MEHTIKNNGKLLKISLIITVLVFSIAFFANKLIKNSIKSKATDSCNAGLQCTNDTICGAGGHCALGIDGTEGIGRCLCSVVDPIGVDGASPPDDSKCPALGMPSVSVEGCHYKELTQEEKDNCVVPQLICDENRVCGQDGICGFNQSCIQPPMPTCPEGMACTQVMPQKICQTQNPPSCPVYDVVFPPAGCRYEGNYPGLNGCPGTPKLICDEGRTCNNDYICGYDQECKSDCPDGAECFQYNLTCQTSSPTEWWFDDKTQMCQEKPFNPMPHMYLGLREFKTKDECIIELKKTFTINCPAYGQGPPIDGCIYRPPPGVDGRGCELPPELYCGQGISCQQDSDCAPGQECYQQLSPVCSGDTEACTQKISAKLCRKKINNCPKRPWLNPPDGCFYKILDNYGRKCPFDPILFCNEGRTCEQDGICGEGKICFQEQNKDISPKICKSIVSCPVFSPPPPWCQIVGDGGVDANGCKLPPQIKCPVNIADADGDGKTCLTDYNWLQNSFNGLYDSDNSDKKTKADFNKNKFIDDGDMILFKQQYDQSKCGQGF